MSVVSQIIIKTLTKETFATGMDPEGVNRTTELDHSLGTDDALNSSSSPAIRQTWSKRVQLSGGAFDIDLTALDRGNLPNLDLTGFKLQTLIVKAPTTNTSHVVIKPDAVNGYDVFGVSGLMNMFAGMTLGIQGNAKLGTIGASAKIIDLSSSDADAFLDVSLTAG